MLEFYNFFLPWFVFFFNVWFLQFIILYVLFLLFIFIIRGILFFDSWEFFNFLTFFCSWITKHKKKIYFLPTKWC